MDCDLFRKRRDELGKGIMARKYGLIPEEYTKDQLINYVHFNYGVDSAVVKAQIESDTDKESELNKGILARAVEGLKDTLSAGGITRANQKTIQAAGDAIKKTFTIIPPNVNRHFQSMLTQMSGLKEKFNVGKDVNGNDVYVGAHQEIIIHDKIKSLASEIGVPFSEVRQGLIAIGGTRGQDTQTALDEFRKNVNNGVNYKGEKVSEEDSNLVKKQMLPWIDSAEKINKFPAVRSFMRDHYNWLDAVGKSAVDRGIFKKDVAKNYFHNSVFMEQNHNPANEKKFWDVKEGDTSYFKKAKTYNNLLESAADGYIPATNKFDALAGAYSKQVASAFRPAEMANRFVQNALLGSNDPTKWRVGERTALAMEDPSTKKVGEESKFEPPKDYEDLGKFLGEKFKGIHAHPAIAKWAESFTRIPRIAEPIQKALNINNALRGSEFSLTGIVHGGNLWRHQIQVMTAAGDFKGALKSMMTLGKGIEKEGANLVASNHPDYLFALESGLKMSKSDIMRREARGTEYTPEGEKTLWTKTKDYNSAFQEFIHHPLFAHYRDFGKVAMFSRMTKTGWFDGVVKNYEKLYPINPRRMAGEDLATALNDHFGGQNLEAIGISNEMHTAMSALMNAPDFQLSKIRKVGSMLMSDNPNIRSFYRKTYAVQIGMAALFQVAMQGFLGYVNKDWKQTWSEIFDRIFKKGQLGNLYVGKTKQGEDRYIRTTPSEQEEWRPFVKTAWEQAKALTPKSAKEAKKDKWKDFQMLTGPVQQVAAEEAKYKASPLGQIALTGYGQAVGVKERGPSTIEAAKDIWKGATTTGELKYDKPEQIPSSFSIPFAPWTIGAGLSELGRPGGDLKERLKKAVAQTAASAIGLQVQYGFPHGLKKKKSDLSMFKTKKQE